MVKNLLIFFSILVSIILMFFISLSSGIRLGDFSYENVSIKGLYLKYDEKIIIDTENIIVYNEARTKSTQMKIKFSVENFFDQYFIHVENFFLKEPFLKVSGFIVLDPKKIDLDNISNLYFNDFSIQFSRNLKAVHAQKCFVKYKDESFFFSFQKPQYGSVTLDQSEVVIREYDHVQLKLKSNDKLNNEVLQLLSNYKVDIPIKQITGTNEVYVDVKLPFDIKKDIEVHSRIDLQEGKILLYDIPLHMETLKIQLDNNILKGVGRLHKEKSPEDSLSYSIDKKFEIDFKTNKVNGMFILYDTLFENIKMKNASGHFTMDFNKGFSSNIKLDPNALLEIKGEQFAIGNFNSDYENKNKTFNSRFELFHSKEDLKISIEDIFSLNSLNSQGEIGFEYKNETNTINLDSILYKSYFKERFSLSFEKNEIALKYNDTNLKIDKIEGNYFDNRLQGTLKGLKVLKDKPIFSFDTMDFLLKDKNDIQLNTPSLFLAQVDLPLTIQNLDIHIQNYLASYSLALNQNKLKGDFDLQSGDIRGGLVLKNEIIDFIGNLSEKKTLQASKLGLDYKQFEDSYQLKIKDLQPLQEFLPFFKLQNGSSMFLKKQAKNLPLELKLDKIDLDIFALEEFKKKSKNKKAENTNIAWTNSAFILNDYKFPFKKGTFKITQDMSSGNIITDDESSINIKKDTHKLVIASNNIGSGYANQIFEEDYFENGYFELFLTNKTINTYEGVIKIDDMTFKKLQLIDNLLLFVNSTPALINPFLALPTLFRFTQNKFKIDGYHATKGEIEFVYYKDVKILELKKINTEGNINNFIGNLSVNLNDDTLQGKLSVVFLKDFATVLKNIPLMNKIILDKNENIALPVHIKGTLKDPEFGINN